MKSSISPLSIHKTLAGWNNLIKGNKYLLHSDAHTTFEDFRESNAPNFSIKKTIY